MKKRTSRLIAVILCLVMCVSLCACGTDLSSMLVLKKCGDAVTKLDSVSFALEADAAAEVGKLSSELKISGDCVWVADPFGLAVDAETEIGSLGTVNTPLLFTNEDEKLVMYVGFEVLSEPVWIRSELGPAFTGVSFDLEEAAALLESSAGSMTLTENETGDTYLIELSVPTELLLGEEAGEGAGLPETVEAMITVDKESSLPVEITAEAAPLVQFVIGRSGISESALVGDITVNRANIRLTLTETNQVKTINIPNDMCVVFDMTPETAEKAMEEPEDSTAPAEPEESPVPEAPAESAAPEAAEAETDAPAAHQYETPEEDFDCDLFCCGADDMEALEEFYEYLWAWFSESEAA